MPKSKPPVVRTRHDTRNWVLKALGANAKPEGLLTSEIKATIDRLSGTRIPEFSLYSALRTLLKRKTVTARRRGRQYQYRLAAASTRAPPTSQPAATPRLARAPTSPVPTTPAPSPILPAVRQIVTEPGSPTLPKLAPGEAVILHVGEQHVETVTNVHGRVVLERHPRPAK